jgi:hypothetical protein
MTRPHRRTALMLASSLSLLLAACGGGDAVEGEQASARPPQEQTVIAAADVETPFELQAGRYKFGWDAPGCKGVDFTMTGQAQGFVYSKTSALPKFSAIVSNVPEDVYLLTQADAACTEWEVRIDRIGS